MTNRFPMYQAARFALAAGLMTLAPGLCSAQAPRCTTLIGTYAVAFSGMAIFPPSTTPTAFAGVAIVTYDGAGKWSGVESANFGGLILRSAPFSGTYILNADCTGTTTDKFPNGSTGHTDFVLADGGKTIHAVGVDAGPPGTFLTITGTKMPPTW